MQIVGQPAQIAVANERILGQMSAYKHTPRYIYINVYNRKERKKEALNEEPREGRQRRGKGGEKEGKTVGSWTKA